MIRLTYDPELVEETVLQAERAMPAVEARAFRRERNRLYRIADPERREAAFRSLHLGWFARIGFHESVGTVVAACEDVARRLDEGRVLRAVTRNDEGADLVDHVAAGAADERPILVLRLRPATVLDPDRVRALLHHELMHVADMLDPAFGYARALPSSDDGPSGDNIQRDRYRVLWDVTIDGRRARRGLTDARLRDARREEFAATFAMLGDEGRHAFDNWFDRIEPTHAALVAFAQAPNGEGSTNPADAGRCPLCHFPVAALDPHPGRLSAAGQAMIRADYPAWRPGQGLCAQCLDLYEARHEETADVRG